MVATRSGESRIKVSLSLALALATTAGATAPAAVAAPSGLKFSHRFHLTRAGAKCGDCHAAAATSRAAGDSLLPLEKDCLVCHDGRRAPNGCAVCHDEPMRARTHAPRTRTYRFPHELHLAFGDVGPVLAAAIRNRKYLSQPPPPAADLRSGNACAACHRGMARTDLATHRNLPQMADCISCHTHVDPPFSCGFCHTAGARLKPASHTPDFLDSHSRRSARLDKPSCAVCHGISFRCLGCH